jgi:hypothetical protein
MNNYGYNALVLSPASYVLTRMAQIMIPLELMLAIGFGIDILLAYLGVNIFKSVRNKLFKSRLRYKTKIFNC